MSRALKLLTLPADRDALQARLGVLRAITSMCAAIAALAIATAAFAAPAFADDARPAAGIADNSFLIEEAYNQEAGVVQHIATFARQNGTWTAAYTDEWPMISQVHQFSYTVPYAWLDDSEGGADGIGDVLLNYRYQALFESDGLPAFAPRISLILPTGDENRGLGDGSTGYQINLPVSKIMTDRITLHGNAGLTSYFDIDGHQPVSFHAGGSMIYAATRDFNLMLEALHTWDETVNDVGALERDRTFTLSPGIRTAFNRPEGQLVLGIAAPIEFSAGERDYGVFFYGSFEHSFLAAQH